MKNLSRICFAIVAIVTLPSALFGQSNFGNSAETISASKTTQLGITGGQEHLHSRCLYSYEYDDHGNWIKTTETWEVAGNTTVLTKLRQITYFS